jgi:energy-coupling factor transport system permease protein
LSQFEFSRTLTVGQYLPLDSLIHRLDPRAKIIAYIILLASLTATAKLGGLLIGLAVVILCLLLARIPLGYSLRGLIPPLPFLLFLAVLQVFITRHSLPSPILFRVWQLEIHAADLMAAVMLLLRFCALILGISLSSFTLSTNELTRGLARLLQPLEKIKIPTRDLVMIIQVMLHFLPILAQVTEHIAKAQASRGADWDMKGFNPIRRARQVLPILLPLFLTSLQRAETMALAMDARGYGSSTARTSLTELHFHLTDWIAVMTALLTAILVLISG